MLWLDQRTFKRRTKIFCGIAVLAACLLSTRRVQAYDPGYPFNQFTTYSWRFSKCGSYGDTPMDKGPAWAVCTDFQLLQEIPPQKFTPEIQKLVGTACARGSDRTMAEFNATSWAKDLVKNMQFDEIRAHQANGGDLERFDPFASENIHCESSATGFPPDADTVAKDVVADIIVPPPAPPPTVPGPHHIGGEGEELGFGEPPPPLQAPPRNSITFTVHNNDRFQVGVSFFSQSRNVAWPGGGKQWNLGSGQSFAYQLSCNPGENICFGAWRDHRTIAWGVGHGDRGCTGCCQVCGYASQQAIADAGEDTGPPSTGGSNTQSAGPNNAGSIIGGLTDMLNAAAAGAAAGSSIGGALGGLRTVPEPPAYGPNRGPSTITGH